MSFIQSKYYHIKREVLQNSHLYQVTLSYWLIWLHVTTFRVVCSSSTSIDFSCFKLILRDHWFDCKPPPQLYIATFQQDLLNKYISISYSNIPELVVPIMNGSCYERSNGTKFFWWLKSFLRNCYGRYYDLVNCYRISVSQMTT